MTVVLLSLPSMSVFVDSLEAVVGRRDFKGHRPAFARLKFCLARDRNGKFRKFDALGATNAAS